MPMPKNISISFTDYHKLLVTSSNSNKLYEDIKNVCKHSENFFEQHKDDFDGETYNYFLGRFNAANEIFDYAKFRLKRSD